MPEKILRIVSLLGVAVLAMAQHLWGNRRHPVACRSLMKGYSKRPKSRAIG